MKHEKKPVEPIQSAPTQKDVPAKKSLQQEVAEKFFD